MKKIAFFTTGYYPINAKTLKAIESLTYLMAAKFASKGYEVHIFGSKDSKGDFVVHELGVNENLMEKSENGSYYYLNLARNFCEMVDYCNKNEIDIIFDQTNSLSYTLSRYSQIPVISILHGPRIVSELSDYYRKSNFTYIISPSKYIKKISPDIKVHEVIPHGVDIDNFQYNRYLGKDFISIGRIIPDKGQLDAIKIAEMAKANLIIAGYHPDYLQDDSYFQKVVTEAGESKYCKFVGRVERNNVPKFMANAKALLMPVKWHEPFGLVMIESMATGTPVVAYETGSIPELIVDKITGFIIPPNDIQAMTKAVKRLIQMPNDEYQKMRQNCRKHVEDNFTIGRMIEKYEDVSKKLIQDWKNRE